MTPIVAVELVLAVAVALLVACIVYVWLRRRYISGGKPLMLCAVSTGDTAAGGWAWHASRGIDSTGSRSSVPPCVPDTRGSVTTSTSEHPTGWPSRSRDSRPDAVCVRGQSRSDDYELASARRHTPSLRAWLESSPPGFNVNVA